MLVRRAISSDYPPVRELLLNMVEENGLVKLNLEKAEKQVWDVFINGHVFVVEHDGNIVGTSGLSASSFWYSTDKFLGDWWTYITPEARNTRAGVMLIRGLKAYAKELGIPLVIGPTSPVQIEAKLRFYRRFLPIVGGLFMEK